MQAGTDSTGSKWLIQGTLMVLAVYVHIFMEWLFFVTKQSFMTALSAFDTLKILLASPAPLLLGGVAVTVIFWIPAAIIRKRKVQAICSAAVRIVTAAVLTVTMFLLVDNFTYTLFNFGVRTTEGILKAAYGLLLAALLFISFRFLAGMEKSLHRPVVSRVPVFIAVTLVVLSAAAVMSTSRSGDEIDTGGDIDAASLERRPNIFLISTDGLNASNMSIYGYRRATTPFLDSMASKALVCENCFPNAGTSGASIASMLTGKLPTETKLIYPPEILKGRDAYQHLPGILRKLGYRNIDISIRHHADPEDLNLRNSFHWANFRDIADSRETVDVVLFLGQTPSYFLRKMGDRIMDRILHVAGRKRMEDPLGEVVRPTRKKYGKDTERIKSFFQHVRGTSSPLFVHMHLLGTHGPIFKPERKVFSRGKKQSVHWEREFYDDAILTFDFYMKRIVLALRKSQLLEKSVIVIFSDHGQNFTVNDRLPLIFLFPGGEHSGRIEANVQNLDIAATIMDYMGVTKPGWMGGLSLISPVIDPKRLIFTADPKHRIIPDGKGGKKAADRGVSTAPFYSLKAVGVHCCHKFFELDLDKSVLTVSNTPGHTASCDEGGLPGAEEVGRVIIDLLAEHGYDTSPLKTPPSIRIIK